MSSFIINYIPLLLISFMLDEIEFLNVNQKLTADCMKVIIIIIKFFAINLVIMVMSFIHLFIIKN